MGRTVALLNQKGGVGKTAVTLGLASAAAEAGNEVLVVDLDPQASSTWLLGVDPEEVEVSIGEVLGRTSAESAIVESAWSPNIHLIPSTERLKPRDHGRPQRLRDALKGVVEGYDAVLIDCPPSLGNLTTSGLTAADHALIVVEPSSLGLRGIAAVADLIDEVWDENNPDLELTGVIVNRVPAISSEADRRYDELTRIVGKKAVWQPVVPQRVIVNQAMGERRSIHSLGARSADVSNVFDQLWRKLRRVTRA
jgi:chromosome partitioning protein